MNSGIDDLVILKRQQISLEMYYSENEHSVNNFVNILDIVKSKSLRIISKLTVSNQITSMCITQNMLILSVFKTDSHISATFHVTFALPILDWFLRDCTHDFYILQVDQEEIKVVAVVARWMADSY